MNRYNLFWSGAPYEPNREEGMNAEIPISLVDITGKRNQYETLNSEKKRKAKNKRN